MNAILKYDKSIVFAAGIFTFLCVCAGFYWQQFFVVFLPLILCAACFFLLDFKWFYYALLFLIPVSIEIDLPGGFSTDFPTELLVIALMVAFILHSIKNKNTIQWSWIKHPVVLGLGLHFLWICIAGVNSTHKIISLKFCLAKAWYIIGYGFFTAFLIQKIDDVKKLFWLLFTPTFFTVVFSLIKHSTYGFSFAEVNEPVMPFYRNHVVYAAFISLWYPFIWLASSWYKKGTLVKHFLDFNKILFLVAIYFSYTRACMLALVAGLIFYFLIKRKIMLYALYGGILGASCFVYVLLKNNYYLQFAPEFTKTIYHDSFDKHLEATFSGKDASSMERIHMWVAATHLSPHYPFMGVGPGNFYPIYKKYSVLAFQTYLSDNDEHLTCHNYFLLLLSEQGWIGLIVFILFSLLLFYSVQQFYNSETNPTYKNLALAIGVAFIIIYVNLFLSDLIENAKIGSSFFILIGLLAGTSYRSRNICR